MAKNQAFINKDGIVEIIYHGDQNIETMQELIALIKSLISELPGKVDYLIDVSDAGHSTLSARRAVFAALKQLRIHRQAIFGGNTYIKSLINMMIRAVGKNSAFRYFGSRAEAEA